MKLSKEEKELLKIQKEAEKQQKTIERLAAKAAKEAEKLAAKEAKQKPEPTETELVHKYVNRVIKNQMYHGRVDASKFSDLEHDKAISKNLWLDHDFFFSVVFQCKEQKYEFIKQLSLDPDWNQKDQIQIVNGLELAKKLGVTLRPVTSRDYPTADIELLPFILDNEEI